jgi:hypothetical protein
MSANGKVAAAPATANPPVLDTSNKRRAVRMSGGLIAAITALVVLVVAAVILATFLTRHVKANKITNYLECRHEVLTGITLADDLNGNRSYWLGTLFNGVGLYTNLAMAKQPTDGTTTIIITTTPYILTAFGFNNRSGSIASPMIGEPFDPFPSDDPRPVVTPPPPLAKFDWALVGGKTLDEFNDKTKTSFAPLQASAGAVGALAVISVAYGTNGYADFVFICAGSAGKWHPLCLLGGTVVVPAQSGNSYNSVHNTQQLTYSIGCMPLLSMLSANTGDDSPGVCFLNAHPQFPTIGGTNLTDYTSGENRYNQAVLHQPYGHGDAHKAPTDLKCLRDPNFQQQAAEFGTKNKGITDPLHPTEASRRLFTNPVSAPSTNSAVTGCSAMSVPAFDVVSADNAHKANPKYYTNAVLPYGDGQTATDPALLPPSYVAKVGSGAGIGIIRMRQWGEFTKKAAPLATVLQQSNPSITYHTPKSNPYAGNPIPVPGQYTPSKTSRPNAVTLLYQGSKPSQYTPFTGGQYDPDIDPDICGHGYDDGGHVKDPVHTGSKPMDQPVDEGILSIMTRTVAYQQGSKLKARPFQFILGFGIDTGTIYLNCGRSLATLATPSDLMTTGKPCAYCNLPTLSAKTVCWGMQAGLSTDKSDPGHIFTGENTPYQQLTTFDKAPWPLSHTNALIDPPLIAPAITDPKDLDTPYAAIGAAIGRATSFNGSHATNVLPWTPLCTVPSGDGGSRGFGEYNGSPANSAINISRSGNVASVRGPCAGLGPADFSTKK